MHFRLFTLFLLLAAALPLSTTDALAKGAAPGVPAATLSGGDADGGADVSDGITPADGGIEAFFEYGGEAGLGTKTTVIDFTLPSGVTVVSDPSCDYGLGELCLAFETDCAPSTKTGTDVVLVSGNTISFRLACDINEGFGFFALLDSLKPAGTYGTSEQFKTTTLKRGANNMWQIKLPGTFEVGAP